MLGNDHSEGMKSYPEVIVIYAYNPAVDIISGYNFLVLFRPFFNVSYSGECRIKYALFDIIMFPLNSAIFKFRTSEFHSNIIPLWRTSCPAFVHSKSSFVTYFAVTFLSIHQALVLSRYDVLNKP